MVRSKPRSAGGSTARTLFLAVAISCALVACLPAATVIKNNNTLSLNQKKSWSGNKVPTSTDIVLWNSTVTSANTSSLGGNLSFLGIQITNPGGLITINAGNTLTLGASGIDMSAATVDFNLNSAVVLGTSQTWNITGGRTLTSTGIVSGSGNLTKAGAGILILSGANTYTGNTTINGGTLSVATGTALGTGSGALTINSTGIFQATGTFSTARMAVLGGTGGATSGGTFDVTAANNETRTGMISGTGSLTKTGSGTLTLSALNTYTGDTYINGGVVSANNSQALGALPPSLGSSLYAVHMASGTTLQTTFSTTADNRQLQLISGTSTLDVTSGVSQQRNGLVYGSGGLMKSGSGTEILTNANTYTGGTTINGGTLQINNPTGSGTGTGAVTVNSGGVLSGLPTATGFANAGTISGTVTVNGGGALLAKTGSTFTFGGLSLSATAISNFQIGPPTGSALINVTGTNGFTLAGLSTINISNAGGLGAGTYQLFNYTGTALANIANLQLGSTPGGGFTYSLSNNQTNTSVDLIVSTSSDQWRNDANGNWGATGDWSSGVVPNSVGAAANFFGLINQARTVTVDNAYTVGAMTFNNANGYTIAGDGVSGHGLTLSNNGNAFVTVLAGSHTMSAPLALTDNVNVTAASSTSLEINGIITQNNAGRSLTLDGLGTVTLGGTASNTYTGLTTVSAGTLNLNKTAGVNAIGSGGLQISSGATTALLASNQIADTATVATSGTFALGTFSETIGALTGDGNVTVGNGSTLTVGASNNLNSTFAGVISGAGTIAKAGIGTFTLTGSNTFGGAGQTVSINGGVLEVNADAALGNSANSLTLNNATLLLSSGLTSSRNFVLTNNSVIDTDNDLTSLSGTISGTGMLVKNGTGDLSVTGANSYTGGTTINNGTVTVNSASSLGATSGTLTINAGTLEVATGYTSARNVILGNAASTIQVNPSQTFTTTGVLSGTGSLNKSGSGTLTLTGANTFTGGTVVADGTVIAAATSGSALASTSSITVNAGGTLLLGASNQINNTAAVNIDGGTLAKGNFSEGAADAPGMGALTLISDGSHLDFGTGTVGVMTFAAFTPGSFTLTIDNWTGAIGAMGSGTTDRLVFALDQAANLGSFSFTGYSGAMEIPLTGGYYEIVPAAAVPEASTWIAAGLAVGVVGLHFFRRLRPRRRTASET
jgi:fibronectin-binding autotransporter adhesin